MGKRSCVLLSTVILLAVPAAAVELHQIDVRTGTDGLLATPLTVTNNGTQPITCNAALAHWYSTTVAEVAPGSQAAIPLWTDPQSGTVSVLNDKNENMPVEALYCGIAGRTYETRAMLELERRAGAPAAAASVACSDADGVLACGR